MMVRDRVAWTFTYWDSDTGKTQTKAGLGFVAAYLPDYAIVIDDASGKFFKIRYGDMKEHR
jgi:hypothetical protein